MKLPFQTKMNPIYFNSNPSPNPIQSFSAAYTDDIIMNQMEKLGELDKLFKKKSMIYKLKSFGKEKQKKLVQYFNVNSEHRNGEFGINLSGRVLFL